MASDDNQKRLVVSWATAEALWVGGNDPSVPKPCLSLDKGFLGSNTIVCTAATKLAGRRLPFQ